MISTRTCSVGRSVQVSSCDVDSLNWLNCRKRKEGHQTEPSADAHIFAPNLHAMGLMSSRDFQNYLDLFQLMERFISPPDLMICRASLPKLVENIQKRRRDTRRPFAWITSTASMSATKRGSFCTTGKLLVIDVDNNRFHENKEDLGIVIEGVDAELRLVCIRFGADLLIA